MMGSAPADLVFARGKLRLYRLRPRDAEEYELGTATHRIESPRYRTPVLVVPPLMVRPYIYDLRPEHSMLRTLRDAGLDVFVVDFGVPDRGDRDVRLDDYVLDFMPSLSMRPCKRAELRALRWWAIVWADCSLCCTWERSTIRGCGLW